MSFRDCILGKIAEQKLDKKRGENLLNKYDRIVERHRLSGADGDAPLMASEYLLNIEATIIEKSQRNAKAYALKQKEIGARLDAAKGKVSKVVANDLQDAQFRAEGVERAMRKYLNEVADDIGVDLLGLSRDYNLVVDGVRSLLGGKATDPRAKKVGDAFRAVFDYGHARYEAAGGILGKIENYFPQVHSKDAILKSKASKQEWGDFLLNLLDQEKMIDMDTGLPFNTDKLKKIIADDYDSILSDGRIDLLKKEKNGLIPSGAGSDIDMRYAKSRFYQFKSPDAFLEYNRKFGVGDNGLVDAMSGKIHAMSRDIALLEKFVKPDAAMRYMDHRMEIDATNKLKRDWVNGQYRVLAGRLEGGDTSQLWWRLFAGTHNWLRSAMLGTAPVSALSDTAFISATAKINGLSSVGTMKNYMKLLVPGSNETKQLARRAGFLADVIGGNAINDTRFAGENLGNTFTGALASATHRFSGLQAMTRATQDSISLEAMATIGESIHSKKAWDKIPEDLRDGMSRFGFTESDWGALTKATVFDNGQAKFLIPGELRADAALDPKVAADLGNKLDDWISFLRQSAANEPLLATKALTTGAALGGGGAATASRVVGASLGLFKSFPITVMLSHTLPALKRIAKNPTRLKNYDHFMMTTIGTALIGGVAMQLREMAKGKTPREWRNYKFGLAALLQGGGFGLFGDFFLGDYSRFDRNPITEALGPGVGLFEDIYKATKGNLDKIATGEDSTAMRDLFRVAKRNIPLGSLWYGRLILERTLLDNVERMIDPRFDHRMRKYERKLRKETGQEFWWGP